MTPGDLPYAAERDSWWDVPNEPRVPYFIEDGLLIRGPAVSSITFSVLDINFIPLIPPKRLTLFRWVRLRVLRWKRRHR